MVLFDWIQILILIGLGVAVVPFLGTYMSKVFRGESTFLHPLLRPLENFSYRAAGVSQQEEMGWKKYAQAMLIFNLLGLLVLVLIQVTQKFLPFNPQDFGAVPWLLAINTAMSFVTNTNWQAYAGETTMSYFTQMCGLTVQNFLSAATGMERFSLSSAVSQRQPNIGNFWADLVRTVVYLLLPLAFLLALVLVSQGVVQPFHPMSISQPWKMESRSSL